MSQMNNKEQIGKEIVALREPKTPKQWLEVLEVMKKAGFKTYGEEGLKYAIDNKIKVKLK
jgi:hypothetical protein